MKAYSIGREANCDIVIYDSTDVVSRRHAVLNVYPSGKMYIVDQSRNGTYVNGIRVTPNVQVPVTRKDIVSFAHVVKLDWNQVPAANLWIRIAAWVVGVILLASIGVGAYYMIDRKEEPKPNNTSVQDSIAEARRDSIAKADSLAKIKADSIAKVKADSIAKKKADAKKKAEEKRKKAEEDKKKEKKDSTTNRIVG